MGHYDLKQVIVVRRDLNMGRGKESAQVAHASMGAVLPNLEHNYVKAWLNSSFAKIVVSVNSEQELLDIAKKAEDAGLINCLIKDRGFTEFGGVHTYTTVGIGPAPSAVIDLITGNLKLR